MGCYRLRSVETGDVCGVLMVDIYSAPEAGVQDTLGRSLYTHWIEQDGN